MKQKNMVIEQSKEKKNNLYIELLRFVFCVLIFLHHSGHVTNPGTSLIPSGGLLADGFFMLTGYYAFRHIEKVFYNYADVDKIETIYKSGYSMKYTIKKIVRLYPYIFFGTSIIYILEIISVLKSGEATALDFAMRIREFLVEITMLPLTGILQNGDISLIVYRNTPMWYLSALLLSLPVLMYFVIQKI